MARRRVTLSHGGGGLDLAYTRHWAKLAARLHLIAPKTWARKGCRDGPAKAGQSSGRSIPSKACW